MYPVICLFLVFASSWPSFAGVPVSAVEHGKNEFVVRFTRFTLDHSYEFDRAAVSRLARKLKFDERRFRKYLTGDLLNEEGKKVLKKIRQLGTEVKRIVLVDFKKNRFPSGFYLGILRENVKIKFEFFPVGGEDLRHLWNLIIDFEE